MIDKIKKIFLENGYEMEIINGREVFIPIFIKESTLLKIGMNT